MIDYKLELDHPNASVAFGLDFALTASNAFFDLYHAAEKLRQDGKPVVLQFVGVGRGIDTGNIAATYAKTASGAMRVESLYLDATGNGIWAGPDMMRASREGFMPRETALPTSDELVSWGAVGRLLALASDDTASLIKQIRSNYEHCVINCGSWQGGLSAVTLIPMCDATVLVTDATSTRPVAVGLARAAIGQAGGRTLGAIHTGGLSGSSRWIQSRA